MHYQKSHHQQQRHQSPHRYHQHEQNNRHRSQTRNWGGMEAPQRHREPNQQRKEPMAWGGGRGKARDEVDSRPSSDAQAWQQVGAPSAQRQRHGTPNQRRPAEPVQQQNLQRQDKTTRAETNIVKKQVQKVVPEIARSGGGKSVHNKNNLPNSANPKKKAPNKKRGKTKPSFQTMSIGDMISLPASLNQTTVKASNNVKQESSLGKQSAQTHSTNASLDSQSEFPALGSPSPVSSSLSANRGAGSVASKSKRPAWGLSAPIVAKEKPTNPKPSNESLKSSGSAKGKGESKQTGPIRVLQRGEALPGSGGKSKKKNTQPSRSTSATLATAPNKKSSQIKNNKGIIKAETTTAAQDAAVFRWGDGDEHQLMRIMMMKQQQGSDLGRNRGVTITKDGATMLFAKKKGRQRLAPRKKRFTALKKKVLLERLNRWKELHPDYGQEKTTTENEGDVTKLNAYSNSARAAASNSDNVTSATPSEVVIIKGFIADAEELLDDDEYQEIETNLREMAVKVGPIDGIYVPHQSHSKTENGNRPTGTAGNEGDLIGNLFGGSTDERPIPVLVKFQSATNATAAQACWDGLVIGGESLRVSCIPKHDYSEQIGDVVTKESPNVVPRWVILALREGFSEMAHGHAHRRKTTVILQNVLTEDDYSDADCMEESLNDITGLAQKYGNVANVRPGNKDESSGLGNVTVTYDNLPEELENGGILTQLSKEVLSGSPLVVRMGGASHEQQETTETLYPADAIVILKNALTDDDIDDEECLEESLKDIRQLAERHGKISNVSVQHETRLVEVKFAGNNLEAARLAAKAFAGLCLGGMTLEASLKHDEIALNKDSNEQGGYSIYLHNLLTEDDMEDEDCLEESLNDAKELGSKFGDVAGVVAIKTGLPEELGVVELRYNGPRHVAEKAANEFNGMIIGGQIISASLQRDSVTLQGHASEAPATTTTSQTEKRVSPNTMPEGAASAKKARTDDLPPLYSGDKLISERFAECKRVPKIPNSGTPRNYANIAADERVKPLLVEMLGELMRLQKRAVEDKNAKARRRLVMGLREVARGIRAHKVKMVVMANNLDEYGAIDQKLQEIIDLAKNESVPLFFEFTKRSLGKAIGKSIKVAVVGIQNADGAHQPFKKLAAIANKL